MRRKTKIQDFNFPGFQQIKNIDESNQIVKERLCSLANDASISRIFDLPRYQLIIDRLYELPIDYGQVTFDQYVAGLNTAYYYGSSRFWTIGILMQKSGYYISHEAMVDTLLHEVAYCHHLNHTPEFFAEWDNLRALYQSYERERCVEKRRNLVWLPLIIHHITHPAAILGGVIIIFILGKILNRGKSRELSNSKGFPPPVHVWKRIYLFD